ncbi:MAG: MarR family transcriptional regulator [Lachnospiraceae bacterium]|nr:MarR family transcriptional regulator [Lachnospiraceae bacterium]
MVRNSLYKKITQTILEMPEGSVMAVTDFASVAKPKTVSKILQRLEKAGLIQKVLRSIFWRPDGVHSSPGPQQVAMALARENNWEVVPSGKTALLLFGLSDEQPAIWTYVTDGTYRDYSYDGKRISFTHSKATSKKKMSEKTKLLVQCLKAYGKDIMEDDIILQKIAGKVQGSEWADLLEETAHSSAAWVKSAIKKMFRMKKKEHAFQTVRNDEAQGEKEFYDHR